MAEAVEAGEPVEELTSGTVAGFGAEARALEAPLELREDCSRVAPAGESSVAAP